MKSFGRIYLGLLRAAGAAAILGSLTLVFWRGMSIQNLLILGLVVPASWLRINLEPKGYVTLVPIVMFTAFLLADPYVAILVAAAAPLIGALLLRQRRWGSSLEEAGGEGIAALTSVVLVSGVGLEFHPYFSSGWLTAFVLAAGVYVGMRYFEGVLDARVSHGAPFLAFSAAAGKAITANLVFFALLAVGMNYLASTFGTSGYFALALATVAIAEAYYPYKQLSDQRDVLFASLAMVAHAIDLKDAYTGRHARDASDIAVRVARALHLSEFEVRRIRLAGMLHDIGKIGVSGRIIRKPTGLDAEEMALMRRHPVIGAEIMRPVELLADSAELVRHHHEHFDGSGYPDGLSDGQIPVGSRILLVADAFNAITTDRPYRAARSKAEALRILRDGSGKQFDPVVVEALESIAPLP